MITRSCLSLSGVLFLRHSTTDHQAHFNSLLHIVMLLQVPHMHGRGGFKGHQNRAGDKQTTFTPTPPQQKTKKSLMTTTSFHPLSSPSSSFSGLEGHWCSYQSRKEETPDDFHSGFSGYTPTNTGIRRSSWSTQ